MNSSRCFAILALTTVFSLGLAFPVLADDEVCIVNLSDTDVQAGGPGAKKSTLNSANNAFCMMVSLLDAGPNSGTQGVGMWAKVGEHDIEVNIEDPYAGKLEFTSADQDFNGANLGPNLHMYGAQKGSDGVYRLIIKSVTISPEIKAACQDETNCTIASAASWGTSAECPNNAFMFGACGSGSNADCNGHPVQGACRVFGTFWPDSSEQSVVGGGFGERIECPDDMAVTAVCGSGENADCNGKSHVMTCQEIGGGVTLADSRWLGQYDWGANFVRCDADEMMTGYCGSGMNKDCNGDVALIQCTKVSVPQTDSQSEICDDAFGC